MNEAVDSISAPPHLCGLNPPQLEAVTHFTGPILVLAGAGSGKTRVLTRRVANLILTHGVRPHQILAVTFTNKATQEMKGRLYQLLGDRAEGLWVSTFHAMGVRILRRHASKLGFKGDFSIYDDDDSIGIIKSIMKTLNVNDKEHKPRFFQSIIDNAKNTFKSPEQMAKESKSLKAMLVADIYDRYQRELTRAGAMDFGDLLVNTLVLLKKFPEVALEYQERLKFVLVDEFQDTNLIQYEIIRILTKINRNLLVVGDDDQSIYAFRGATIQNILNFERDFPETKVIKLEENYRSTNNILEIANQLIAKNKGRKAKKLWTSNQGGEPVIYAQLYDEEEEADFIVQTISAAIQTGRNYKDIAIFYRTNAQSRAIEDALMRGKVPYKIFGGLRFYDRKEIKDIVAYLRLIANESDNQAFLRCVNTPPRGIGAQAIEAVRSHAESRSISLLQATRELAETSKALAGFITIIDEILQQAQTAQVGDLINSTIELSQYRPKLKALKDPTVESRLENLAEFVAVGRSYNEIGENKLDILHKFLDKITLATSQELPEAEGEKPRESPNMVSLMTLHLAKGLEFPMVFFTGLEEGLVPHYRAIESGDPAKIEEERRLCYVGITRAMEQLFLSRVHSRAMFQAAGGFASSRAESRFLSEIDQSKLTILGQSRSIKSGNFDDDFSFGSESVDSWGFNGSLAPKFDPQKLGKLNIPGVIAADSLPTPKVSKKSYIAPETINVGMRVKHDLFGKGTVQLVLADPINPKVEILFDGSTRVKKLLLNQSGLEIVEQ